MDVAVAPASSGPDAPPPLMATYSNITSFGSPPSDGDLDLQWDQTYLRINYIVRNLAGPVPLQLHHHSYQHLYAGLANHDDAMSETSSERRRRLEAQDPTSPAATATAGQQPMAGDEGHQDRPAGRVGDSPTLGYPVNPPETAAGGGNAAGRKGASTQGWRNWPAPQAAQRHARVSVWTEEVSAQGEDAYCACSAPWAAARLRPPPEGAGDEGCSSTTARGLLPAALVAGSAGGSPALASPAANTAGPGTGRCGACGRPLDPAGNQATGSRSNSSYSQDNHVPTPESSYDNDTGGGENPAGGSGATKKAFSRMSRVLHRFRRSRAKRDLQDLINENNGAGSSNSAGDHEGNGGTNGRGGENPATQSSQGQDGQQPRSATTVTPAPTGSSVTLMYRTEAPGNGGSEATVQQARNNQPGPRAPPPPPPIGQGNNNPAAASGPAVESSESSAVGSSSRRARSSAARLERARRLLERSNGQPLPHPPPPTAPPPGPPPAPPSGGSKGKGPK